MAGVFQGLRSIYESSLGSTPILAIEHVGSTAVEGLAAKPVIDVDIVVASQHVGAAGDALRSIGFRALGEQGIEGRWAFRQPEELPATNTYVVAEGSLALRNHLAVRNTLRADAGLRARYAQLKRQLASSSADTSAYVEGKSTLLRQILEQAGLGDDELSVVERANRAD